MAIPPADVRDDPAGFPPLPSGSVVPYLTPKTGDLADAALKSAGGVVLSGADVIERARAQGRLRDRPVLIDVAAYKADKNEKARIPTLRPAAQFGLFGGDEPRRRAPRPATVFTGGSLVTVGDHRGLVDALTRPVRDEARSSVAVVALTYHWFRGFDLKTLIAEIRTASRPVAIALADAFNPLNHRDTVDGLVRLIGEVRPVPVALLRCDVSAVGAVAYGASLGAVGLTTTSRHYATGFRTRPGVWRDSSPRLFVPALLDYFKASKLTELVTEPDDPVLSCLCEECDGESLLRFAEDDRVKLDAERHNLHATEDVAWRVVRLPAPRRPVVWRQMCRDAFRRFGDIREQRHADVPQAESWLRQWCELSDAHERWRAPPF
jgi:hypothetical protein